MSDIRIKMAKDLRDMSDMVGDLHWMAAKAVEDLTKKDGEIAKRDEELAACRVAVENCEAFRARIAELEARIVELESAAESLRISRDYHHEQEIEYRRRWAGLYAAPVSEAEAQGDAWAPSVNDYDHSIHSNPDAKEWADFFVATFPGLADKHDLMIGWFANAMMAMHDHLARKAQGVVMPEQIQRALDFSRNFADSKPDIGISERLHILGLANLLEKEARLNAAPVAKQVVMQSTNFTASNGEQRNPRYQGQFEGETHDQAAYRLHWVTAAIESERLNAAQAAPAADAWIAVSERLPDVPDGDEQEVIVCVKRAHNGQSYSFSARYLNNFPLHSDYEDEPTFVTGWHDVKEHADYDGWYSTLIDKQSGDEVTHWMPLPAAPVSEAKAHGNYAPASVVWIDAHHVIEGNNPSFIKDVALVSAERTSETQIPLARLNAAPAAPAADAGHVFYGMDGNHP